MATATLGSAARRLRRGATSSTGAELAGRLGLCARGAMYVVTAALVLRIATGDGEGSQADRTGALEAVGRQPLGRVLLLVLAAGFAGYAAWRLLRALTGAKEGRGGSGGTTSPGNRLLDVGRAALYATFVVSTLRLVTRHEAGSGGDEHARTWTGRLMAHTGGRWLVIAAGVAIVVGGGVLVVRAVQRRFERHLDRRQMSPAQRRWLPRLGVAGYTARGVVVALVGAFLVHAGVVFDPNDAVGVDGALRRLAGRTWGPAALAVVAAGLAAFGAYSFVEARWRRVLED